MFQGAKNFISDLYFKKIDESHRNVKAINIKEAKTIGILYLANDAEVLELVKRYVKHLHQYPVKISTLGYYKSNELHHDLTPKLEFDFFCKKDLNIQLRPNCSVFENFVENSFDILIDTSVEEDKSIRFATIESKAKFKVGFADLPYANCFDLTIQLPEKKNIRELMKNIDRYLHLINK